VSTQERSGSNTSVRSNQPPKSSLCEDEANAAPTSHSGIAQPGSSADLWWERLRPAGLVIDRDHHRYPGRDAALAGEHAMLDPPRCPADRDQAGSDIDRARPEQLGAEIDLDPRHEEAGAAMVRVERFVAHEFDAAGLGEGGEDGVVDMALAVGVAQAQLIDGPALEGGALCRGGQGGLFGIGHGFHRASEDNLNHQVTKQLKRNPIKSKHPSVVPA